VPGGARAAGLAERVEDLDGAETSSGAAEGARAPVGVGVTTEILWDALKRIKPRIVKKMIKAPPAESRAYSRSLQRSSQRADSLPVLSCGEGGNQGGFTPSPYANAHANQGWLLVRRVGILRQAPAD
jgi:hypothetical protein